MRLKTSILILIITYPLASASGQIKLTDLYGDWETNNRDSLFYKTDTVEFFQAANHFIGQQTCDIIVLRISKQEFKIINKFLCTEPGREKTLNGKQTIKIRKAKSGQAIEMQILGKVETFEVLSYKEERVGRYPWDIKRLKLRRV